MIIDLICLVVVVLAVIKGFSKGFIVGIFSFAAFIIGLAAALKLSTVFANYLREQTGMESRWLPALSFIILFIGVSLLIRLAARLLKGVTKLSFLGWADTLGGIILYVSLYLLIFSVFLFFGTQLHLLSAQTQAESKTYSYIKYWGPWLINSMGVIIPVFKNIFADLQRFFEGIAR